MRQRTRRRRCIAQRLHDIVGRLLGRFTAEQQLRALRIQQCQRCGIARRLRMEQARGAFALQIEAVHERAVAFRRGALAEQEQAVAIGTGSQQRAALAVGHRRRRAGIVVAVLRGTVPEQFGRALRLVRCDTPLLGAAGLPPALAEDGQIAAAPLDAFEAATQLHQRDRRARKWRGLHQHRIADLALACRVAAVLRLGPDQRGRRIDAPGDVAHAGGHGVIAGRQAFHQRQPGDLAYQLALQVQHLDTACEVVHRHQIRERPFAAFAQDVTAIRRHRQVEVDTGRGDRAHLPAHRDDDRLAGGVVLEYARIGLVAQQVLIGRQRAHAGGSAGLLGRRAVRHRIARGRRALPCHLLLNQQPAAIGQPAQLVVDAGVQAGHQTPRLPGRHVDQPQLVDAAGRILSAERQVALIRRPAQRGQRQWRRQPGDLPLTAVGYRQQPQLAGEGKPAAGEGLGMDAQTGQLELGLGDLGDIRQRRHLQHRSQITFRRDVQ